MPQISIAQFVGVPWLNSHEPQSARLMVLLARLPNALYGVMPFRSIYREAWPFSMT
jgi:hypothetical protein